MLSLIVVNLYAGLVFFSGGKLKKLDLKEMITFSAEGMMTF